MNKLKVGIVAGILPQAAVELKTRPLPGKQTVSQKTAVQQGNNSIPCIHSSAPSYHDAYSI